jgi:CBS domain-containing protein/gamma-glutamyl:cysteine ligase YbdK (ATP-grasp superfamily)
MGEHDIATSQDAEAQRSFMRALLEDVRALERMINEGRIESGVRRIGAEQELFFVDEAMRPLCVATQALEALADPDFTTELASFNLEANLPPSVFGADCLGEMERGLDQRLARVREVAAGLGARALLVGILPTLERSHLTLESMTPNPRYLELNQMMSELCGGEFHTLIKGLDELKLTHDNVMLEACNTSFQIHFQVAADEFAELYNVAQAITGPVLAASVNSPLLLRHRLWHETRVALFQQSLDVRSQSQKARGTRQRVYFGDRWVRNSVIELFQDDIARFRSLIRGDYDAEPMAMLDRGELPRLRALCLHNGTVYRWNRPCFGVKDNVAHLRIENRVLPSGPTVLDEVANAAFFFGLMSSVGEEFGDIAKEMAFDDAKGNFMAAARYGLKAQFHWVGGRAWTAEALILQQLLPLAHAGLARHGISSEERERYLGVIEERVRSGQTGAQWALDSLAGMDPSVSMDARLRSLASSMEEQQWGGKPVHEWSFAEASSTANWRESFRTVEQIMTTDLFTVHPEDLVDLAASVMDWEHIRHVPVEDTDGQLVGILSHRAVLRLVARGLAKGEMKTLSVGDVMQTDPITVTPSVSSLDAMRLMREHRVSCLPVLSEDRLVGIVTEHDFIHVAARLLEEELSGE